MQLVPLIRHPIIPQACPIISVIQPSSIHAQKKKVNKSFCCGDEVYDGEDQLALEYYDSTSPIYHHHQQLEDDISFSQQNNSSEHRHDNYISLPFDPGSISSSSSSSSLDVSYRKGLFNSTEDVSTLDHGGAAASGKAGSSILQPSYYTIDNTEENNYGVHPNTSNTPRSLKIKSRAVF